MDLIFINNDKKFSKYLTHNKWYDSLEGSDFGPNYVLIENDAGQFRKYKRSYFMDKQEWRDKQIGKIIV